MEVDLAIDPVLFLVFGFLVVGALLAGKSDRLRVPASLLFLVVGMVAGDDVLGLVSLDDPALVQNLGVVALLIILFEGGLTTKPSDLRRAAAPGFVLSNVGVLITAGVVAGSVRLLLDVDWTTALLLGAVVSSTDAAAVFSLLKRAPLPRRIAAVLEVESGFLAVYIAGLAVGAFVPRHRRSIRSFHASLANTADIGLFLVLGLLVFPSELPAVALPALTVTVIILLVARPAAVVACLTPFRVPWREQAVAAWGGLRGAVPIVLSTFRACGAVHHRA